MYSQSGPRRLRRSIAQALLAALVILTSFTLASGAPASAAASGDEQDFLDQTNAIRGGSGLGGLVWDDGLANIARWWSSQMAGSQTLAHNGSFASQVNQQVTSQWTRLGENVGFGPSVSQLMSAFMNSQGHRDNILGDFNRVGIGVVRSGATIWVTVDFLKGPSIAPPPPPPPPATPLWFLRNSLTTGVADSMFGLGIGGDHAMACDWNGDGIDTPGIFRNGQWFITDQQGAGGIRTFGFGGPGDTPLCGDWNGDGKDSPGVYRAGRFFLRNSNTSGYADFSLSYGDPSDRPAVGDWNGDGVDTIGIFRNGFFFLKNSNTSGIADLAFGYGNPGDRPLIGDWNGNGVDTIGIWRNGALFLKNNNVSGYADYIFGYGNPGDAPIIGDWNKNGSDELGVVRGGA